MIKAGDSLQTMRRDLDLSATGSLTEDHMRARARKFTGSIGMSDLHKRVIAIGEVFGDPYTWVNQTYWVDRKANIYNDYNPAYLGYGSDWDGLVGFRTGSKARDGTEMWSMRYLPAPSADVGMGMGTFNHIGSTGQTRPFRLRFQMRQDETPGPLRFGVVEVLGCTQGYLAGNIEYCYRESTRLGNPMVVDETIYVGGTYPYICAQFSAITKGSGPGFVPTTCYLDYLEITEL